MPSAAQPYLARLERFDQVGSTNDVVAGWLAAGEPEACVAVADEQVAGRGRAGRSWTAPPGAALLLSVGFRPTYVEPERAWRLPAIVALAMADAVEDVAGLPTGTIRLKWPNDLVVVVAGPGAAPAFGAADEGAAAALARLTAPLDVRKLAGLLGETTGLGTADPRAVVGIGVNADWAPADFPPGLAGSMTSLREASGGRPIDREALLGGFLDRLETRHGALRGGRFDVAGWTERQVTTGRVVRLEGPGGTVETARATGVDALSGALLIESLSGPDAARERAVLVGEVAHLRLPSAGAV